MAAYADCLAGFIERLGLEKPHVAGLSFGGALALELYRRHYAIPRTLILASGYARMGRFAACRGRRAAPATSHGTGRSVPRRVRGRVAPDDVLRRHTEGDCRCARREHAGPHPAGFRAMARASAEDLRDVLPDTGHLCNIEAPDAFNNAVRSFLRDSGG